MKKDFLIFSRVFFVLLHGRNSHHLTLFSDTFTDGLAEGSGQVFPLGSHAGPVKV